MKLATTGDHAPGAPADVNYSNAFERTGISRGGRLSFNAGLTGTGVNSSNNIGLFAGPAAAPTLVARTGDHAPGTAPGVNFQDLGVLLAGPVSNNTGRTAFFASVAGPGIETGGRLGVWFADADNAPQLVALAPAAGFLGTYHLEGLHINGAGQIAYQRYALATNGIPHQLFYSDYAISIGTPGAMTTIAAGQQAPGMPAGQSLGNPSQPLLNAKGQILFSATAGGAPPPGTTSNGALFLGAPAALAPAVRYGTHAPGAAPGIVINSATPVALNDRGQFVARVQLAGGGVTSADDSALLASFAGRLYPILREGQLIDAGNGQTKAVRDFTMSNGVIGSDDQPSGFNDNGQLALRVTFSDFTHAVYYAALPTVIPGDANLDGVVDDADFNALYQNLGHPGTDLARGDFNADGRTDFADFQVLELNFGRSIEPLAAPIDPSAVEAFAATVPEPQALCVLLATLAPTLLRRRRSDPTF